MRFAAPFALIALLSPLLAGADENGEHALTDTRREMLQEYKFAPPGTKAAALPTSLNSEAPAVGNSGTQTPKDVIRMAPFEVSETGGSIAALGPASVARSDTPAERAAVKLGTGVHHIEFGKVHVIVNTILYVPFLVGFEW
jgi:hypothetical protein